MASTRLSIPVRSTEFVRSFEANQLWAECLNTFLVLAAGWGEHPIADAQYKAYSVYVQNKMFFPDRSAAFAFQLGYVPQRETQIGPMRLDALVRMTVNTKDWN